MSKKRKKRSKSQKGVLTFLGILIVILSIVFCGYLNNDYNIEKIETDKNAIKEDDNEDKMEVSDGGGAVNLTYTNQVIIDKKNKNVNLYFKNPSKSREDLTLKIYIYDGNEEKLIAESKLIPTGYVIKELKLNDIALDKESYNGYIKVNYYNEETNEKEIVDTKIDINVIIR